VRSRALARCVVVVIATLCLVPTPARAQCNRGDLLVGEDADNYYCRTRGEYQGSAAEKAGTQFCAAKRVLAADQNAIRELGFAGDVERFEMFEQVSKKQKAELQRKLLDAMFDYGLEGGKLAADSAKGLNPWNVNNAVKVLEQHNLKNQTLVTALRRVAAAKGKPAMAEAYAHWAELARVGKEGLLTGWDVASEEENRELRVLLGALKAMQGNPELAMVVTTFEFGESLAYLGYVSGQVGDLTRATDDKLARVGTLHQRLKDDVGAVQASKGQWRSAMGIKTGEPNCGS